MVDELRSPEPRLPGSANRRDRDPESEGGIPRIAVLLPLIVAAIVYGSALDNGFSLDDFNWLDRAQRAGSGGVGDFIWSLEPGQIFNPFPKALLLWAVRLFGDWAAPYHALLLSLHLVNVALVERLGRRLHGSRGGLLAALLFAVLPAFHESIFWLAAFFHPLVTTLYLVALLTFLSAEQGSRTSAGFFAAALLSSLVTKAMAFALVPSLVLYAVLRRSTPARWRTRLLGVTFITAAGIVLLNFALGLGNSYLLERGAYAAGGHWVTNLWSYLGRLGFPFPELVDRLGLAGWDRTLERGHSVSSTLGACLVVALGVVALRGSDWRPKWWAGQLLLCLAPVLPFTLEPTSRYVYLAAVPLCLLITSLVVPSLASIRGSRSRLIRRSALASVVLVVVASWAEVRLVDNRYEYREVEMKGWVESIATVLPQVGVARLTIIGLPTLGVDPGIHLEAGLRLRWSRPDLELRVLDRLEEALVTGEPVLDFDDGAFRRINRAEP